MRLLVLGKVLLGYDETGVLAEALVAFLCIFLCL